MRASIKPSTLISKLSLKTETQRVATNSKKLQLLILHKIVPVDVILWVSLVKIVLEQTSTIGMTRLVGTSIKKWKVLIIMRKRKVKRDKIKSQRYLKIIPNIKDKMSLLESNLSLTLLILRKRIRKRKNPILMDKPLNICKISSKNLMP